MARQLCVNCERPSAACICAFIIKISNKIPVLVLQHPSEIKQSKGTVALLKRSLRDCRVIIGEDFTHNDELNTLILSHQSILLYPSDNAQTLIGQFYSSKTSISTKKGTNANLKPPLLIILDGTWKKAYRMFMLSSNLHCINHACLPQSIANNGQYLIRKVAKKNALSSLEAVCYALAILEGALIHDVSVKPSENHEIQPINCGNYQLLLDKFSQFNEFQLSFRN